MISLTEPFIPPCNTSSSRDECLLVGELNFDTSTVEVLVRRLESDKCSSGGVADSNWFIRQFRIDANNNSQLIWSHELVHTDQVDYVYHPSLAGYFFAFSADTLVLFRGVDGSVHSKLTDVPSGTRYWDYPYGDGIPRLIVTNGLQVSFYNLDVTTGITDEPDNSLPRSFVLGQPYPNPFNAELTIPVTLQKAQDVTVDVFNITGERVARLYEGRSKSGENLMQWDASGVSSGIYLIRAVSKGETRTEKAVLLK